MRFALGLAVGVHLVILCSHLDLYVLFSNFRLYRYNVPDYRFIYYWCSI